MGPALRGVCSPGGLAPAQGHGLPEGEQKAQGPSNREPSEHLGDSGGAGEPCAEDEPLLGTARGPQPRGRSSACPAPHTGAASQCAHLPPAPRPLPTHARAPTHTHTQEPPVGKGPGVSSLHFNRAGPAGWTQTVTPPAGPAGSRTSPRGLPGLPVAHGGPTPLRACKVYVPRRSQFPECCRVTESHGAPKASSRPQHALPSAALRGSGTCTSLSTRLAWTPA